MKVKELIKLIESDGWYWVRTKGSHRQFKHPVKLATVTIPGNLSKDIAIGTLQSVLRQAQIEELKSRKPNEIFSNY